ncbi:hypothetical protein Hanom_Chr09g00774371 [Helianthus anomalus]
MSDLEKQKLKKRKRSSKNDDNLSFPSPEHVQDTQTPPSSGGRKKTSARKRDVTSKAARKLTIKLKPKRASKQKQPTPPQQPPSEPQQQPDPIPTPPHQ